MALNTDLSDAPKPQYEAYYEDEDRTFWLKSESTGHYIRCDRTMMRMKLRQLGFAHTSEDGSLPEVDAELLRIIEENHVIYAGPLAGKPAGLLAENPRVLVTSDPKFIRPEPGDWSDLENFFSMLLGDQDVWLYGWLHIAYEALYNGVVRPGQILAIAGEPGCGKSLAQVLISELFGRSCKPFRYMSGGSSFNGDLFMAEHLCIGDEAAGTDIRTRRHFGKELKQVASEPSHSCHKKGCDAFNLSPFWRCTITLNDDGENLLVLPPMDTSMMDKTILLKAIKATDESMKDGFKTQLKQRLVAQLPAFAAWLLEIEVPSELADDRYGIKSWQHPELMAMLGEHSPEERLWELIVEVLLSGKEKRVEMTAAAIEEALMAGHRSAGKVFTFATACGVYLGRLEAKKDGRVGRVARSHPWTLSLVEN